MLATRQVKEGGWRGKAHYVCISFINALFFCSRLLNCNVPLLQIHREPGCSQAGAKGAGTQEDPAGH